MSGGAVAPGVAPGSHRSVGKQVGERDNAHPQRGWALSEMNSGDVLLSQGVSPQVPSAQAGLTSVFGMGTGVTLPLWSPETFRSSGFASCRDRYAPRAAATGGRRRSRLRVLLPTLPRAFHSEHEPQALGRLVPVG